MKSLKRLTDQLLIVNFTILTDDCIVKHQRHRPISDNNIDTWRLPVSFAIQLHVSREPIGLQNKMNIIGANSLSLILRYDSTGVMAAK